MLTTPRHALPYPEPTDPITDYPDTAEDLATLLDAKLPYHLRKVTPKAATATVAATDLLNGELTIPAGILGIDKAARLVAHGDYKNNSGGAIALPRWQLFLGGGVALLDTGAWGSSSDNSTRWAWTLEALIFNAGAANVQTCRIKFEITGHIGAGTAGVFTTGTGLYGADTMGAYGNGLAIGVGAGAVDTTAAKLLELKVINGSANANVETKLLAAVLELGL